MDTNILELNNTVNVTVHKNHLLDGSSSFARVKRRTIQMNSVIAEILKHNKTIDKATLIHSVILFEDAILDVLKQGFAVDLFGLGTIYLTAQGSMDSLSPLTSDIPQISLGFTPSEKACKAVRNIEVDTASLAETNPIIFQIEDRFTFNINNTITAGKSIKITGRKLKISGDESKVGVFFAEILTDGSYSKDEASWIQIKKSELGTNLPKTLEFYLPESIESGKSYALIIKTANGYGKRINKTIRTHVYDNFVTVA